MYYQQLRPPPRGRPPNHHDAQYHQYQRNQNQRVQPMPPKFGPMYPPRPHGQPNYIQPRRQHQTMYPTRPYRQPPLNQPQRQRELRRFPLNGQYYTESEWNEERNRRERSGWPKTPRGEMLSSRQCSRRKMKNRK